jgi:nucleotide-binding universal stress UspA family protein
LKPSSHGVKNVRKMQEELIMGAPINSKAQLEVARTIFSRVLVGVDGSPESFEAVRQAALLKGSDAKITCLSAWIPEPPRSAGMTVLPAAPDVEGHETQRLAEDAVRGAQAYAPSAETRVVEGFAADALRNAINDEGSTLAAIGSHGQGRATGIVLGSTATKLLHDAPCSILLTRERRSVPPRRIAVGVDGSSQSASAYLAARYLVDRFDGDLTVVVADGDELLDLAAVSLIVGDGFHVTSDDPVPVLTAASANADLLVLGSRGLYGLKSLGSVSERVAHRAAGSVLVVRSAPESSS